MTRYAEVDTPAGFRQGSSGLLVPLATERTREVWCATDRKALDRAAKACAAHGVKMTLACQREGCSGHLARLDVAGVGDVIRCACSDRILSRNL